MEEATCVAVGGWNLTILNPRWIAKEILGMPEGTQFPMEVAIGPTISLKAQLEDLFFIPGNDRIIVNPCREDKVLFGRADDAMGKLYETLPHTPITAVGYNFQYQLEEDEVFAIEMNFDAVRYNDAFKTFGASAGSSSAVQHSLALNDDAYVVLNVAQKIEGRKKTLALNYHYQANNEKDRIMHSLKKFLINYEHSKATASRLIKKEGA